MNMVTQIICLGRMEVGDWYYTVHVWCYYDPYEINMQVDNLA